MLSIRSKKRAAANIYIVIALAIIFIFLVSGTAFGMVFALIKRLTGAQASSSAICSSIPDGGSDYLHTNITTTTFGGCNNGKCADSQDNCMGSGGISTGCDAPTDMYAALPLSSVAAQCQGDVNKCAHVQVINPSNNKSVVLAVVDTGPWNTNDKDYVFGQARPQAETGIDTRGRTTNRAGLDISPKAMSTLSGGDKFNWRFTNLTLEGNTPSGCYGTASGIGLNNVPLFKQGDPRWGSLAYNPPGVSGRTIRSSGCGPTSVAMVLSFYGKNITPDVAAKYSLAHGYRVEGGTSGALACAMAKEYGLQCEDIGQNFNQAWSILKNGQPLILSVKGPSRFTSVGHFLVLTGMQGNTIYVNDSGGRNVQTASAGEIETYIHLGFFYIHP